MNNVETKNRVWAVRVKIDENWHTVLKDNDTPMHFGGRTGFARAKRAAIAEIRAMRYAHMTAIVEVNDLDCIWLYRTAENNFTL